MRNPPGGRKKLNFELGILNNEFLILGQLSGRMPAGSRALYGSPSSAGTTENNLELGGNAP